MNRHAVIKIPLARPHLDRDPEALQDLGAADAEDVQAHDLLVLARAHELVAARALIGRLHHGVVHGREAGGVDLDGMVAVLPARLRLREADGADFRVGEDDRGDEVVVELGFLELGAAEEAVRELAAGGDGDGGELDFANDVAERVDVLDVGVLVFVRDDLASLILLYARLV